MLQKIFVQTHESKSSYELYNINLDINIFYIETNFYFYVNPSPTMKNNNTVFKI